VFVGFDSVPYLWCASYRVAAGDTNVRNGATARKVGREHFSESDCAEPVCLTEFSPLRLVCEERREMLFVLITIYRLFFKKFLISLYSYYRSVSNIS